MSTINTKTVVAVLASHDSERKNEELAYLFEELYASNRELLGKFHFLFTGGTFGRLMLREKKDGKVKNPYIKNKKVRDFIKSRATVLPSQTSGGVTILANLIVQRQCSIIWPFLSPITVHWLHPENLALMRLCDLWNTKRLMTTESVRAWFRDEAERDEKRNPQKIPLKIRLGTPEKVGASWPEAERKPRNTYYEIELPTREKHHKDFWTRFDKQTIALIAHDAMKSQMVDFAIQYETELGKFERILATGTTGQEIENACRTLREQDKVKRCLSGPKGGDIEIATEILLGRCHIVIFFIDPLHPHAHIDDIRTVFSACMAEIENNEVRMLTNDVQAREWVEEAVRRKS